MKYLIYLQPILSQFPKDSISSSRPALIASAEVTEFPSFGVHSKKILCVQVK